MEEALARADGDKYGKVRPKEVCMLLDFLTFSRVSMRPSYCGTVQICLNVVAASATRLIVSKHCWRRPGTIVPDISI